MIKTLRILNANVADMKNMQNDLFGAIKESLDKTSKVIEDNTERGIEEAAGIREVFIELIKAMETFTGGLDVNKSKGK